MPSIKKIGSKSVEIIEKQKVIDALVIVDMLENDPDAFSNKSKRERGEIIEFDYEMIKKGREKKEEFIRRYSHEPDKTYIEVWEWTGNYFKSPGSYDEFYAIYLDVIKRSDKEPIKLWGNFWGRFLSSNPTLADQQWKKIVDLWVFKGSIYETDGLFSDDQFRLLIFEHFDKERRLFEKLKAKFDQESNPDNGYSRPRIPENVRVEVWRRDGGKCARCGSREKLEYDHIVPISKGGSNTARNIELLCEKCNRSKSNNVV